jgi:Ca2+-binding EF-hand superfamily protein
MLCALGKVSADDIEKIYKSFNSLDEDKSGELDLTDIADTICESQDVAEEVV